MKKTLIAALALSVFYFNQALADLSDNVKEMTNITLTEFIKHKESIKLNPRKAFEIVNETIAPHFHFESMTKSALGRFSRNASDEQLDRLSQEFGELLTNTYANVMKEYNGQKIEYMPARMKNETDGTVLTKFTRNNGNIIPIQYTIKEIDKKPFVIDVKVEGMSLVSNYRSSFAREVQIGARKSRSRNRMSDGIEQLIQTLKDKNFKNR